MRMLLASAIVLALGSNARAQSCPDGGYYTTNGSNLAFCLFENISQPPNPASPYCNYLQEGYIGFSWNHSAQSYSCPPGSVFSSNGSGIDSCLYEGLTSEAWAQPYCNYLDEGYIGYSWLICPPGAVMTSDESGDEFCLWENLKLPNGLMADCGNLESQGEIGFSFPLAQNAGYRCPSGFTESVTGLNKIGIGLCMVKNLTIPSYPLTPYCQYLTSGHYLGFSWQQNP